jgi:phosphoribosyl 1,2-cyclic phosphate phosphodiesterase
LKITFLGTGTSMGVPMIACDCEVCRSTDSKDKRTRSSVKIEVDGKVIVVDTGPDFRQQMLSSNTKRLNAILFTHEHKDHTAGLDDVRAFNWINREPSYLFGEERTLEALKNEYAYAFKAKEEKYPGAPELFMNEIGLDAFEAAGNMVQPIRVFHHKMPVLGYRTGDFSYVTDASNIPAESMDLLRNSKVLVLNALRIKPHISHFSLKQAIEVIQELAPERAYLTHISHHMGFHSKVSKQLPPNIHLGYDGLEIEI